MTVEDMQTELANMLATPDLPGSWTQRQRDEYETKRRTLEALIRVARQAQDELADIDNQFWNPTRLGTDHRNLTEIRAELATELVACPRAEMDRVHALKISIQATDGRGFDLMNEAIPLSLPLFEKLKARGYVGPAHAPWNPMAALFGSLPTIERRLADLQQRRAMAQARLDAALRDPVSA